MVTVAMPVEFERQIHAVFHEIQIPFDGANGHFKLAGKRRAIRVFLVLDQVVEAHHSLPKAGGHKPGSGLWAYFPFW